ncbi:ribosomal protein S18-alanine N-acetyltransferase [Acidicapsa ligni]|uniref:ribosomal protein S18-alanine N-acetyltransferase n=1 Tax=Acidicapsa ligni TaxID=542300 RepID=UPI0021E0C322|nr:ribosomal protein S18-alanine N-acetyltransferase [Acidicapsa ligni]
MSFFVRAMRESDIERVMTIAASLAEAPHWPREAYIAAIAPDSTLRRVALVAQFADGVAGFVVASVLAPQSELESIAVTSTAQRQGVATALLRELTGELSASGVEELLLELRASNARAADFYEQYGFMPAGRRRSYYQDPVEDALLLRLNLPKNKS